MDDRALIFSNLLNGVPKQQVAATFKRSQEEVDRIFLAVLRKLKSYCFMYARGYTRKNDPDKQVRAYPIIAASTLDEAKKYRLTLLGLVGKINLDAPLPYRDVQTERVNPDNVLTIARNIA